jgi:hypothetical protein
MVDVRRIIGAGVTGLKRCNGNAEVFKIRDLYDGWTKGTDWIPFDSERNGN